MRGFTEETFWLAIRLAKDARAGYKSQRISQQQLRDKFDHIRWLIGESEMSEAHFQWLLEGLK